MARKGSTSKVGKGVSTKGKSSSAVAKCKKKLAHGAPKEPRSPDPPTSDSDDSVQPIEIYKGSPPRVEYPRAAKRKRKTPEPAANPVKRRRVTKTPDHTQKTPDCVKISSRVESTESHNDSASAGSPASVRPPCESTQRPSYTLRSHHASSPPPIPQQPSLPRRGQIKPERQRRNKKIGRPLHELSRISEERELYDASSIIGRPEQSDDFDSAGPPATDCLSRSSYEEHGYPQSQIDVSSLGTRDVEESSTSQNLSITQETQASSVTPAISPYHNRHNIPLPRFDWETSNILKVIPVDSKPVRLKAVCRSSDGTKQSIELSDLIDRCPRKVALYFQKAALNSYQTESLVAGSPATTVQR